MPECLECEVLQKQRYIHIPYQIHLSLPLPFVCAVLRRNRCLFCYFALTTAGDKLFWSSACVCLFVCVFARSYVPSATTFLLTYSVRVVGGFNYSSMVM